MKDIRVLQFARLLGSKTVSDMAQKVGLKWPPPPISLRNVVRLAGIPLQPSNLQLQWDVGGILTSFPPDSTEVPVSLQLSWDDPGAGTLRQATAFEVTVRSRHTLKDWGGGPIKCVPPQSVGLPPNQLDPNTIYDWWVDPLNDLGYGTRSFAHVIQTGSAPPPPPKAAGKLHLAVIDQSGGHFKINAVTWTVWGADWHWVHSPDQRHRQPGSRTANQQRPVPDSCGPLGHSRCHGRCGTCRIPWHGERSGWCCYHRDSLERQRHVQELPPRR